MEARTIDLTPNYRNVAKWYARVFADKGFMKGALAPVIAFIEVIAYLATKDPEGFNEVMRDLKREQMSRKEPDPWSTKS